MTTERTTSAAVRASRYQPHISIFWWLTKPSYLLFVLRELSSLAIAWFVVFLLLFVRAVYHGEAQYEGILDFASNPFVVFVNLLALAFVLLHTVTWFALTPQAMPLRVRGQRVPGGLIIASQYVGWIVVSAFVFWLVVGW